MFNELRDADGFFSDGLDVLARGIAWIKADSDRDECLIALPGGRGDVEIMLNGGVPFYFTNAAEPMLSNYQEITASAAVALLEGAK